MSDEMEVIPKQKRAYIPRNRPKRVIQYPSFKFTIEEKLLISFLLTDLRGNKEVRFVIYTPGPYLPYQFRLSSVFIKGEYATANVPFLFDYSEVKFSKWRDPSDPRPLPKVPRTRTFPILALKAEDKLLLSLLLTEVQSNEEVRVVISMPGCCLPNQFDISSVIINGQFATKIDPVTMLAKSEPEFRTFRQPASSTVVPNKRKRGAIFHAQRPSSADIMQPKLLAMMTSQRLKQSLATV